MRKFIIPLILIAVFLYSGERQLFNTGSDNNPPVKNIVMERSPVIPELAGDGAVLVDAVGGKIIYGKNAAQVFYPASTTKILTALVAIEHSSPDTVVTVGPEIQMVPSNGSKAGLKQGERIVMKDLLYALMLPSGNDAAYVVAVYVGRQTSGANLSTAEAVKVFVGLMNERAQAAGANSSHFINPDGYHSPDHYSTPYDMALITRAALKNSLFTQIVSTSDYEITYTKNKALEWHNTNKLLLMDSPYYMPAATGVKTGTTTQAGSCLVASADYPDISLISVVLHSYGDKLYEDSQLLLDYGHSFQLGIGN